MRRIAARTPPTSLHGHRANRSSYGDLVGDVTIRRALYEEQDGLCAYCEVSLDRPEDPGHRTKIEHFHPRSGGTNEATCRVASGEQNLARADTAWKNMLLCCEGNASTGQNFHCDTSKASTDICSRFPNPKTTSLQQIVVVEPSGRVKAEPPGEQAVVDDVLCLNIPALVEARRSIQAKLKSELAARTETGPRRASEKAARAHRLEIHALRSGTAFRSVYLALAARLRSPRA